MDLSGPNVNALVTLLSTAVILFGSLLTTALILFFASRDRRDAATRMDNGFAAVRREFVAVREEASDAHTGISDNIRRRTRRKRIKRIMRG